MTTCSDLYLRHTDTNGASFVQCHRVWDADRFLSVRQAEARKANADVKDEPGAKPAPRLARIDIASREDYLATKKGPRK
jgi:hypothetical protein